MSQVPKIISIVVPCYNEEAVLEETARQLGALLEKLCDDGKVARGSKVYFVDDGSRDGTWRIIQTVASRSPFFAGIKLSRNRGHQNALLAGLMTVPGDAVVSIDADLQDDISAIESMIDHFNAGTEVVYGVRKLRSTDTFFKRVTAEGFYRLMTALGAESVFNHADYRLLGRRAIEALRDFREVNLYLRGIVPLLGFPSDVVRYERGARFAGESKYPFRRMLALALEAITSFSVVPLRVITAVGFFVFVISLGVGGWILWVRLFTDAAAPGWASTVLPMFFLGGTQIFCTGLIGEYLGKVYTEVKARPRYVVESTTGVEPVSGDVG